MTAHPDDPDATAAPPDGRETLYHPGPAFQGQAFGRYKIERELGRGGMGVVYLAYDERMGRKVAIKQLLGANKSGDELARFKREAQAVARLQHPNVVQVYDVGEEHGDAYMVLAFVEGESLQARLERAPLEEHEVVRIGSQIASGLAYAHSRSILHRDIKPQNVLLTPEGDVRILDFGLAKILGTPEHSVSMSTLAASAQALRDGVSLTQDGQIMGTPSYMPPEQAEGRLGDLDERTDIYSLGATLYALLTGRPPFKGKSLMGLLKAILIDDPQPPSVYRSGLDPRLEAVVMRCLSKDPRDRYVTAEAVGQALGECLVLPQIARTPGGTQTRGALPTEARERPVEPTVGLSRPQIIAIAVGLLLAIVGGVGGALWVRGGPERKKAREAALREEIRKRQDAYRREAAAKQTAAEKEKAKQSPAKKKPTVPAAVARERRRKAFDEALHVAKQHYFTASSAHPQDTPDWQEPRRQLDSLVTLYPEFYEGWWFRAQLRHDLEDYLGAIQDCNKAIACSPGEAGPYATRSDAYGSLGDVSSLRAALDDRVQSYELQAKPPPGELLSIARLHQRLGELQAAIETLRKAATLISEYDKSAVRDLHEALAEVSMQVGDYAAALESYEVLLIHTAGARQGEVFLHRGRAHGHLGRTLSEVQDYEQYLRLIKAPHDHPLRLELERRTKARLAGDMSALSNVSSPYAPGIRGPGEPFHLLAERGAIEDPVQGLRFTLGAGWRALDLAERETRAAAAPGVAALLPEVHGDDDDVSWVPADSSEGFLLRAAAYDPPTKTLIRVRAARVERPFELKEAARALGYRLRGRVTGSPVGVVPRRIEGRHAYEVAVQGRESSVYAAVMHRAQDALLFTVTLEHDLALPQAERERLRAEFAAFVQSLAVGELTPETAAKPPKRDAQQPPSKEPAKAKPKAEGLERVQRRLLMEQELRIIKFMGESEIPSFDKSEMELRLRKRDQQEKLLGELLALSKKYDAFTEPLLERVRILLGLRRYRDAITDCDEVIRRDPRSFLAHAWRAEARIEIGKDDEAFADAVAAAELEPRSWVPHSQQGRLLAKRYELQEAIEAFLRALALKPNDPDPDIGLALACEKIGDWERAREACSRVLEQVADEDKPEWHKRRGDALFQLGRYRSACADWRTYLATLRISDEFLVEKAKTYRRKPDLRPTHARGKRKQDAPFATLAARGKIHDPLVGLTYKPPGATWDALELRDEQTLAAVAGGATAFLPEGRRNVDRKDVVWVPARSSEPFMLRAALRDRKTDALLRVRAARVERSRLQAKRVADSFAKTLAESLKGQAKPAQPAKVGGRDGATVEVVGKELRVLAAVVWRPRDKHLFVVSLEDGGSVGDPERAKALRKTFRAFISRKKRRFEIER